MIQTKSTGSQQTKSKGNQLVQIITKTKPLPLWVDNLKYNSEGKSILNKFNKQFKGITNIEDTTKYEPNQPLAYSNVPRVLGYNHDLLKQSGGKVRVLSPYETVWFMLNQPELIPELKHTYADTNSIAIYPNAGPNEELRKQVVEGIFGKKLGNLKIPYIALNLKPIPADNEYGFTFTGTDFKKLEPAPYLTKDQKVICKNGTLVPSPDQTKGIRVWALTEQSGLRRFYQGGDDDPYAWDDDLLYSNGSGRVQLIRDPNGLAKNLELLLI
ncbi:MAG: hypothetical protein KKG60_02495 [Nanoarchaeota archaeon]|nr:hypothetical protein [Nanoarchaeota archaeon]